METHRRSPGRPKKLTDAELGCLAVAQVLLGHLFSCLPKRPGYCKRLKAARPLLGQVLGCLAGQVSAESD